MTQSTLRTNERDIRFTLFEHLGVDRTFGVEPHAHVSRDDADMILEEGFRFAREQIIRFLERYLAREKESTTKAQRH